MDSQGKTDEKQSILDKMIPTPWERASKYRTDMEFTNGKFKGTNQQTVILSPACYFLFWGWEFESQICPLLSN